MQKLFYADYELLNIKGFELIRSNQRSLSSYLIKDGDYIKVVQLARRTNR